MMLMLTPVAGNMVLEMVMMVMMRMTMIVLC